MASGALRSLGWVMGALGLARLGQRAGVGSRDREVRRVGDQRIPRHVQSGLSGVRFQFEKHDVWRFIARLKREQMPRPDFQRLPLLGAELVALINCDDASE